MTLAANVLLYIFVFLFLKKEEQEETEERVLSDRVANVDCCIVRIMKARKTIEHNALITEVFKQLQFPLKVSPRVKYKNFTLPYHSLYTLLIRYEAVGLFGV